MRKLIGALALFAVTGLAQAQDFGVMQSAETIKRGNFKFAAYPMFVDGGRGDDDTGIVLRAGHGFTDSFDAEIKAAFYDNINFYGLDGEFWLLRGDPVDLSLAIGANIGVADRGSDSTSLDATLTGSGAVGDGLELALSLDLTLLELDDVPARADDSRSILHLVPGIEYRLSPVIDLIGEIGLAISDDGSDYAAIGLAFYLR